MKYLFFTFFIISFFSLRAQNILQPNYLITCGDDKVRILNKDEKVWEWRVAEATDIPQEYLKLLIPLDECKPIMNNSKLLLTSSGGATIVLDIETKKIDFYAKTAMAHSADLLPFNRIAVANSTHKKGNSLELYAINQPEKVLFSDTLYSGHGVVWNEDKQLLFVLGYELLKAYSLADWDTDNPKLKLVKYWKMPDKGGHDLFMVDAENFLISTHNQVYNFNYAHEDFKIFDLLRDKKDIKSVHYNSKTKEVIYTIAEQNWWTHKIYGINPLLEIHIPDLKLYKVRKAL